MFFSLPLLAVLAACGGDFRPEAATAAAVVSYAARCGLPEPSAEPYRATAPTGGHCIGALEFALTDPDRAEPFTDAPEDRRSLSVRVLYPAAPQSQAARMPYGHDAVYAALGLPTGFAAAGHARAGVPLQVDRPAPVILFSPGLGNAVETYAGLTEDLASHGYVVVTINHSYVSGPTRLPDGSIAAPVIDGGSDEVLAELVADQQHVLDWLEQRNAEQGGPLAGKLDLARVASYGHSLGGATALGLQRLDGRVKAAVNLDGTVYGNLEEPWSKPFMILDTVHRWEGKVVVDETVQTVWRMHRGPAVYQTLPGACHGDFGDLARLGRTYNARHPQAPVDIDGELFCAPDPVALERDVRQRVLAFLAAYLR
ncbi:alpha/beta hydrolase family protein [Pseudoduganella chitinolytica]|uniref:Alpha/beta hydrolase n=1 Tax=Pseudoduganella chitinolytica TaxID=34070 RepID=A0ABY8BF74_9BURK|nr:hypothetical protein [Pseudoduganella chitinolytica]WEF33004.1 hypothetical protein PX653_27045 [Pseudoduganella chitinolytica]